MEFLRYGIGLLSLIIFAKIRSGVSDDCPVPILSGTTYNIIDLSPTAAVLRITLTPTLNSNAGWSTIVIFSKSQELTTTLESFNTQLTAVSLDRRAFTFSNRDHNSDISNRQQYDFTIILRGSDVLSDPSILSALVGFYETPVADGSCFLEINPLNPLPTTTAASTITTPTTASPTTSIPSSTVASTTSSTTTTNAPTTSTTKALPSTTAQPITTTIGPQIGCEEIKYTHENHVWIESGVWKFMFRYRTPVSDYVDWTIKLIFDQEIVGITAYEAESEGPYTGNQVWLLKPKSWNRERINQHLEGSGMASTTIEQVATARAFLCNNGVIPDLSLNVGGVAQTTSTTTASASTVNPVGATGVLPDTSEPTQINFKASSTQDLSISEYDYNEVLHKSLLFYEAQRSGPLPANNRIPWRGDSGLNDGCYASPCLDLVGGYYDAGDFVKFGFPMAFSTTVLAWGMIEFKDAYQDAGEWDNALEMLKWATDYFIKAHVSPNELYVQVGNPGVDHSNWGHPETMSMIREKFKIDVNNPGTEVAAETAAALAASYLVFKDIDPEYANILLQHSLELYDFATNYLGNYHDSLPESEVQNFYRSFSGYGDEIVWGALWLYKATGNPTYYDIVENNVGSLGFNSQVFSWDQKSPGVLVLLTEIDSGYLGTLRNVVDDFIALPRTPAGLTFVDTWGPNRYAANCALIALLTAKIEGIFTTFGQTYYKYGIEQIHNMLGDGDHGRSYVVGFGVNYPKRPHHRASSCRPWTLDPATRVCDWTDKNADIDNPHIIYGALVGGPNENGEYNDDRSDFISNEVALDYNAGFQSAVAGLKHFLMLRR